MVSALACSATGGEFYEDYHTPRRAWTVPVCEPAWGYHQTCWRRFPPVEPCPGSYCPACEDGATGSQWPPGAYPGPNTDPGSGGYPIQGGYPTPGCPNAGGLSGVGGASPVIRGPGGVPSSSGPGYMPSYGSSSTRYQTPAPSGSQVFDSQGATSGPYTTDSSFNMNPQYAVPNASGAQSNGLSVPPYGSPGNGSPGMSVPPAPFAPQSGSGATNGIPAQPNVGIPQAMPHAGSVPGAGSRSLNPIPTNPVPQTGGPSSGGSLPPMPQVNPGPQSGGMRTYNGMLQSSRGPTGPQNSFRTADGLTAVSLTERPRLLQPERYRYPQSTPYQPHTPQQESAILPTSGTQRYAVPGNSGVPVQAVSSPMILPAGARMSQPQQLPMSSPTLQITPSARYGGG